MRKKQKIKLILLLAALILAVLIVKLPSQYPETQIDISKGRGKFGITFSKNYASYLGLDWKNTYTAILDDLKAKHLRIPVYWEDIEKTEGDFDFSDYDYIFDEGKKRNVQFIANIGWRLPRWPECHTPGWLEDESPEKIRQKSLKMIEETVNHFKERPEIKYWQVENEPLLKYFGECPDPDYEFLKKQIAFVESLDDREIIISASGELSTWKREAKVADILGITFYRTVWSKYLGYVRYPVPLWYYDLKAAIWGVSPENRMITELQLEPWVPKGKITELSQNEINKSMSLKQFRSNFQFAIELNWKRAYAWGVEWWYWKKLNGDERYWNAAKTLFTGDI